MNGKNHLAGLSVLFVACLLGIVSSGASLPISVDAWALAPDTVTSPDPNIGAQLVTSDVSADQAIVRAYIENYLTLYAQRNHLSEPILNELFINGDVAYGVVDGLGNEPVPVRMHRQSDGSWGHLAFDLTISGVPAPLDGVDVIPILAQPPTPPRFLTLPFDQQSGALRSDNKPNQGWWYNCVYQGSSCVSRPVYPDPENYQSGDHKAADYWRSDKQGFTVRAAASGEARRGTSSSWGTYVYIRHVVGQETWYTLYAHLASSGIPDDGQGHQVSQGDPVGTAGMTGGANGIIHLHFEFSKNAIGGSNRVDAYGVYGSNDYFYPYPYTGYSQAWTTTPPSYPGDSNICPAPTNGQPRDGVTLNNRQVTFSWQAPSCSGLDLSGFQFIKRAPE